MAKKRGSKRGEGKEKSLKKKIGAGFGSVRYRFGKWRFFAGWFARHTKQVLGLSTPEAEGIRVGASVKTGQVSIQVLMMDGPDVTVAMNKAGARQIIDELTKAINMVTFKGVK